MDTLLFSNNDHLVLGMYFITPFALMFGLSMIADLFATTRRFAHASVIKSSNGYMLKAETQRHTRLRRPQVQIVELDFSPENNQEENDACAESATPVGIPNKTRTEKTQKNLLW